MAKQKCDKALIARAVTLKKAGANDKDIFTGLGISKTTFYAWLNKPKTPNQVDFSNALKKAETDYKTHLLKEILIAASERDWKAGAWLLERKYPEEFGSPAHRLMIAASKNNDEETQANEFLKAWADVETER